MNTQSPTTVTNYQNPYGILATMGSGSDFGSGSGSGSGSDFGSGSGSGSGSAPDSGYGEDPGSASDYGYGQDSARKEGYLADDIFQAYMGAENILGEEFKFKDGISGFCENVRVKLKELVKLREVVDINKYKIGNREKLDEMISRLESILVEKSEIDDGWTTNGDLARLRKKHVADTLNCTNVLNTLKVIEHRAGCCDFTGDLSSEVVVSFTGTSIRDGNDNPFRDMVSGTLVSFKQHVKENSIAVKIMFPHDVRNEGDEFDVAFDVDELEKLDEVDDDGKPKYVYVYTFYIEPKKKCNYLHIMALSEHLREKEYTGYRKFDDRDGLFKKGDEYSYKLSQRQIDGKASEFLTKILMGGDFTLPSALSPH
jgi:hypothetical protein